MRTTKLTTFLIASCLCIGNAIFATNYQTIYECGFEDGEDLSAWDLTNAAQYQAAEAYENCVDMFYVGSALAAGGSKSLYMSNDDGATNDVSSAAKFMSCADLNLNLTAGSYTISFDYKKPTLRFSLYIVSDKGRFDFDIPAIHFETISNAAEWTNETVSFSLTEDTNVWFSFTVVASNAITTPIEGVAIDNVVIKKLQEFEIDENGILIDYFGKGGHVVIPDGVKGIDRYAFWSNEGAEITSITLPNSITNISGEPFRYTYQLAAIYVDEDNENYISVDGVLYNKNLTTIIHYPMLKPGLTFTIPNTVKTIGNSAFYECEYLTTIDMSSVEILENLAIYMCYSLSSINIPNTVTNIGQSSFGRCVLLTDITVNWQDPSTVIYEDRLFSSTGASIFNNATLHIPAGTTAAYQAVAPWSNFVKVIESAASGSPATYRGILELIIMGTPSGGATYLVELVENDGTYQLISSGTVVMDKIVLDTESGNFSREGLFEGNGMIASLESGYIKGDSLVFMMDYPGSSLAVEYRGILFNGYNTADVLALNNFLEQPSAEEGKTNGEQLGLTANGVLGLSGAWVVMLATEALIKDYTVWVNNGGYMYLQELNIPVKLQAGTLDLSDFAYLTKVSCQNNHLTGIVVNEELEELKIFGNRIKLSGLPPVDNFTLWQYGMQMLDYNAIKIKYNEPFDLSSEAVINGKETVFAWALYPETLVENVDYINNDGVFTFINPDLKNQLLMLQMTNENFPQTSVTGIFLLEWEDDVYTGDVYSGLGEIYINGDFLPLDKTTVNVFQEEDGSYTLTLSATGMNTFILPNVTMTETGNGKMSLSMDNPVDLGSGFMWLSSGELDTQNNTLNVSFFSANTLEELYLGGARFLFRSEGSYAVISALTKNGSVIPDKDFATAGETVTLTVNPAEGYELLGFTVVEKIPNNPNSTPVEVDDNNQFIMPENNVVITAMFKPTLAELERQGLVETISTFEHEAEGTFGDEKSFTFHITGTPFFYGMYACKYNLKAGDVITGVVSSANIFVYNEQGEVQDATYVGSANPMIGFKAETDGVYYVVNERVIHNSEALSYYLFLYRYGTIQSISFEGEANISPEMTETAIRSALNNNLKVTGIDSYGEEMDFLKLLSQWTVDMENDRAFFNPIAIPVTSLKLTLAEEINNVVSWAQTSTVSTVSQLASITVQSLQIIVLNSDEKVAVYGVGGQLVASGVGAGGYTVPQAGVYLVKVGEVVRKVVVR